MGNTINKKCSTVLVVGSLVFQGCIAFGNKDKATLQTESKTATTDTSTPEATPAFNATLASLNVSNNIVSITGAGLAAVTGLKIKGNGVNTTLSINSKSDTQIIAVAANALSLLVGSTFELILSSASAQSTFPITFTLDSMNAQPGQVLKFNGSIWEPANLASSQMYLGTWDADQHTPALEANPNSGDYYIVTVSGEYPINSNIIYDIGDWIIYNGAGWEKVVSGLGSKLSITGGTLTGDLKLDSLLRIKGASNYVTIKGSASLAADIILTLPTTVGTSGQVLTTNGSGVLSWTTPATTLEPTGAAGGVLSGTYPNPTITALDATKIANGSVTSAEFQYLSSVTSDIQAQLDSKQAGGNFISALTGDVTAVGPGSTAAAVASVAGVTAANVGAGATLANAATNANTVSTIVKRDASGNFSAGTITATLTGTATNVSGVVAVANGGTGSSSHTLNQLLFGNGTSAISGLAITGTPSVLLSTNVTGAPAWTTSTTGNYLKATTGVGVSFGGILAADLPTAIDAVKIADGSVSSTKFQYLSGVTSDIQTQLNAKQSSGSFLTALTGDVTATGPGSVASTVALVGGQTAANVAAGSVLANAATNANTASTIVKRDASGNFTAGTITATLTGTATNVSGTVAVANGGSGRTTLTANEILLGNGTTGIISVGSTATPSVLLSTTVTGVPVWSTSTTGNYLKATTGSGVSFGAISSGDLPSGTLSGSGTTGKIPYYSAASTLADSPIAISGTTVGVTTASATPLLVESTSGAISGIEFKNTVSTGGAEGILSSNDVIQIQTGGAARVYIGSNFGVGGAAPSGVPFYVKNGSLLARFENTSAGSLAVTNGMNGVELVTGSMNTGNKYGQGIKFMSTDTEFTTEPVKLLGAIFPRATESYNADTRGGTALDFMVTPNNPGINSVPVTAMTIDQNGSVGIGNAAPTTKLDVTGTINSTALSTGILTASTSVTSAAGVFTTVSSAQAYLAGIAVSSSQPGSFNAVIQNTAANGFSATAYNDTANNTQAVIGYANASAPIFADTFFMTSLGGKPMTFGIATSEVARIASNGYFGINIQVPTERLHVGGNILATGTITQNSDRRLKRDIRPIQDALASLDAITGVKYYWIDPSMHNEGEQIGLIAQNVEKVYPQAVITGSDGIKSVSYMGLIAPVIQAIKELNQKFKAIVAELSGMNQKVKQLEAENIAKNKEIENLKIRMAKIEKALAK